MAHKSLLPRLRAKTICPLGDRLMIQRLSDPTETGGILLPERQVKTDLARGTIVAIGSRVSVHHAFFPGQVVRFPRPLGYPKVILNGAELEFIPTAQVLIAEEEVA